MQLVILIEWTSVCIRRLQTTADGKVPKTTADLAPALFFTAVVLNLTGPDVTARFKALYVKDIQTTLPGKACWV